MAMSSKQEIRLHKVAIVLTVTLFVGFTISCYPEHVLLARAPYTPQLVSLPPMSLTLVALNGSQITLDETEIGSLPSYEARGGYKNQLGNIRGLGNYTGIPLNTLCNMIGGITNNNAVRITADDGYNMTFSYDNVHGNFTTYDPATGNPVPYSQSLTPIVAYHKDDMNLSSSEGPLRIAIVGPEGLVTDSTYWVKWVVRLEIRYRDDIAVTALVRQKTIVCQTYPCIVNVTVANEGGYVETFDVSLYANSAIIKKIMDIVLSNGTSTTITFIWNTTGWAKGNYTIKANASVVPDETDKTDNDLVHGWIIVTMIGDINADRKVDLKDVFAVGKAYGSFLGQPKYDPNLDINSDNKIDLKDYFVVSKNFGKVDP